MRLQARCIASILVSVVAALGQQSDPTGEQVDSIMKRLGGWYAASSPPGIAQMTGAERALMIGYYRERLLASGEDRFKASDCRHELLYLGDPEIVRETVGKVLSYDNESPLLDQAVSDLVSAGRPETIAMLSPGILVDEPLIVKPMQGDIGSPLPKSFGIAFMMLEIMAKAPAFSAEVRKWADDSGKVSPQNALPVIRRWLAENEQFLKAGKFGDVRAGQNLLPAELAAQAAMVARMQEYRDELIAQGKSPADSDNWERWRTVIYPSLTTNSPGESTERATPTPSHLRSNPQTPVSTIVPATTSEKQNSVWPWVAGMSLLLLLPIVGWASRRRG